MADKHNTLIDVAMAMSNCLDEPFVALANSLAETDVYKWEVVDPFYWRDSIEDQVIAYMRFIYRHSL